MDKQDNAHCENTAIRCTLIFRLSDEDNILAHNIIFECPFEQPA